MLRLLAFIVIVALALAGLAYWQNGPVGPDFLREHLPGAAEDWVMARAVRTAFELHTTLAPLAIDVAAESGVVTLRGDVPHDAAKATAETVAAAVPDVRQVVNHLRVDPSAAPAEPSDRGRSLGETLDDGGLVAKVRLQFSLHRELKSAQIDVSAYRKVITLTGTAVSVRQKRAAVATAAAVPGVAEVKDDIEVLGATAPGSRRAAVAKALAENPHLSGYGIVVEAAGGGLRLTGTVASGAERDLAGLVARDAAGGTVENSLVVDPAARQR